MAASPRSLAASSFAFEEAKLPDAKKDVAARRAEPEFSRSHVARVVTIAIAGSVLEWYDFSIFGFFAKEIGSHFFPKGNETVHIIESFGVYAGGFLVRPLGALLFGAIGDRWGSAIALQISILAMAIPTTLIGVLPTYDRIGIAATALLVTLRLLQGLMAGGEIIGAVIFTTDNTPRNRRGMFGGAVLGMALLGIFLGSAVATAMHHFMDPVKLKDWGWRIPFLCGLAVGLVGFFVRKAQMEGGHHIPVQRATTAWKALTSVLTGHFVEVLQGFAAAALYHAAFYMTCVWLATYLRSLAPKRLDADDAFAVNSYGLALHILLLPIFGLIADHYGRSLLMGIGAAILVVVPYLAFLLLSSGDLSLCYLGATVLNTSVAFYGGPLFSYLIHNSSALARFTAVGLAYNLAAAAFGGPAPLIASLLAKQKMVTAPGLYMGAVAIFSLTAVVIGHFTGGEKLIEANEDDEPVDSRMVEMVEGGQVSSGKPGAEEEEEKAVGGAQANIHVVEA